MRFIVIGNEEHLLHATGDERRYLMLECGKGQQYNTTYFAAIAKQLKNGGSAALLHHLLHEVDITGYDVRNPIRTDELRDQMEQSTTGGLDVIRELFTRGRIPGKKLKDGTVEVNLVDLATWATKERPQQWGRVSYQSLRNVMGKKGLGLETIRKCENGERTNFFIFPKLSECRKLWDENFFQIEWPNKNGAEWQDSIYF